MKTVKRTLADGTVKTYTYQRKGKARSGSVGALVQEYRDTPEFRTKRESTQKNYLRALAHLEPLYNSAISEIKRRHILRIRDSLQDTPGIADQFVAVCGVLMELAVHREYRDDNPARKIPRLSNGHRDRWTDDQIAVALANFPERFCRAIVLALHTGQRAGDLLKMLWSDYDGASIKVVQQKTGTKLTLPVHPLLKDHLERWKSERTAVTILTNRRGSPWERPQSFSAEFSMIKKNYPELDTICFHGLRSTTAAKLAEAGCSTLQIQSITGHKTLGMIELYTRQADQESRAEEAISRLGFGRAVDEPHSIAREGVATLENVREKRGKR